VYDEGETVVGSGPPGGGRADSLLSVTSSGDSIDNIHSNELFKYSTTTMTWTKLDTGAGVMGTPPSARSEHSMTTVGDDLYVFGGEAGGVEGRIGHAWLFCCVCHQSAGDKVARDASWMGFSVGVRGCSACRVDPVCRRLLGV
jgi:hypothetical protein